MQMALLALALQLHVTGAAARPLTQAAASDSQRIARRAHDAQASFERAHRSLLPWTQGGGGRCDVRIGRFCWWNDEGAPIPAEPERVGERRAALLSELDSLGTLLPTDNWLTGIRVYYHIEARQLARADTVARECRASTWWCSALVAYVARTRGDAVAADSGFAAALVQMPDTLRCAWRDISMLLPGDARGRYEELSCDDRAPTELRYWMLSAPRLTAGANEWRAEFYARRVIGTLLKQGTTVYPEPWSNDVAELGLRYGWPVGWSRIQPSTPYETETRIMGHDASPSCPFSPREEALDSLASATDDSWDCKDNHAPSRFAPPPVRRILPVQAQLARFRRGDSTLLVAAYRAADDSLRTPASALAAALADGRIFTTPTDTTHAGHLRLLLPDLPRLAGVELADTITGTLARSRQLYAPAPDSARMHLSDLLVFHSGGSEEVLAHLDSALAHAVAGESASRDEPLGLYWETYHVADDSGSMRTEVTVERIDHGLFRSLRQRVGLADADSPLHIRWSDAHAAVDGVAARAISLDLSSLPGGRYRVSVALTPPGGSVLVSAREIELTEP
jgi:hypothetical protein